MPTKLLFDIVIGILNNIDSSSDILSNIDDNSLNELEARSSIINCPTKKIIIALFLAEFFGSFYKGLSKYKMILSNVFEGCLMSLILTKIVWVFPR